MGRRLRIAGATLLVTSGILCLAGAAYLMAYLLFGHNHNWEIWPTLGFPFGWAGVFVGGLLWAGGHCIEAERRWNSDLRRGTVRLHDLRPGEVSSEVATQELVCRLEVKVAGLARFDAEYRAAVGPLDAPRLVKGATFACQASPALPDRVRVWLHANPNARDLTGRYLDFSPARSG